ncbi:MAG: hypothetical protein IAG13_15590 [Deltaproteobacteria bacterium]|nr:hypothetical protein [Nannocystaceae bacterium]
MATKLTWIGIAMFLTACAGGDGDDDTMADDSSGSIGDSSSGDSSSGMTTMTTAPTTAETLSTTDTTATDDGSSTDPSATGDSSGDTGEPELSCASYCDTYATSCVDHTEYANEQDCLDNCAQWSIGTAADTANDTLGCRIYHATVAGSTDPDVHCPHAGPSGSGMCIAAEAPTCDVYCMRYFENCEGGLIAFDDEAQCMSDCSTWYAGTFKDTEGHTIGCHSYHANAALGDPATHCPHAGPGGGGICVL